MADSLSLTTTTAGAPQFSLTQAALDRLGSILQDEAPGTFLRIRIDGGGCSGFQYHFSFATAREDSDISYQTQGLEIVIDEASSLLVADSTLDFVQDMAGASFVVKNPNAVSACGCGNSFSII
ncbi:MAG: HesB/IscA family protein [Holosporales bacterium]